MLGRSLSRTCQAASIHAAAVLSNPISYATTSTRERPQCQQRPWFFKENL
jgi:hypothetical protein